MVRLPTTITQNGIGHGRPGYAPLNGDIAEFVVFSAALTTADRGVVGYLAHKWGLTAKLCPFLQIERSSRQHQPTFFGRIGTSSSSTPMRVEFTNAGSLLSVTNLTASSFSVSGGSVSAVSKVADGNYTFTLAPTTPGTGVTVSMASGVKDSDNKDLLGGSYTVRFGIGGLYRPSVLTGYWNFDEGRVTKPKIPGTAVLSKWVPFTVVPLSIPRTKNSAPLLCDFPIPTVIPGFSLPIRSIWEEPSTPRLFRFPHGLRRSFPTIPGAYVVPGFKPPSPCDHPKRRQ